MVTAANNIPLGFRLLRPFPSEGKQGSRKRKGVRIGNNPRPRSPVVVTAIRPYYDAAVAVALTTVFAIVVALIAAVIVGSNTPNVSVAVIVFVFTCPILLFRLRRGWPKSALQPRTHLRPARWVRTER